MNHSTKEVWKVWIAAILWLGLIVAESSDFGSSTHTSQYLYPVLHYLFGMDYSHFEVWHSAIRKSGHFIGYFTLSVLLFRAWRATLPAKNLSAWSFNWGRIAWMMATLVASLDEWHQSYLASRTGNVRDVLLDSSAALVAQVVLWLWLRGRETNNSGKSTASALPSV